MTEYICYDCEYSTKIRTHYQRHLATNKHFKNCGKEKNKNNLEQSLLDVGKFVQAALDDIKISEEELEAAAEQLKLFTNGDNEAIEYAEKELKGLVEGTYWARYWSGLLSRLKK